MGSAVNSIVNVIATAVVMSVVIGFGGAGIFAGVLGGGLTATTLGIGAGILAGTALVASALTVKPKARNSSLQQRSYAQETANRSLMVRQPISARDIVYGESKKSGSILFMDTTDNNKQLHLLVQIASHEIESFDKIYFNDSELTLARQTDLFGNIINDANGIHRFYITAPSKYAQNNRTVVNNSPFGIGVSYGNKIKLHTGSDDQLADADLVGLVSKWTDAHRLRGIAYIYLQLEYDADTFPNGIPNVSAEIKGKKLFDFRDDSTAFSSNPALCIYDYLTDTRLGLGISRDSIDTASFTTMANLCDENVTKAGGGTEKRYTCNGIVYSDIPPMNVLDFLLTSCVGILSYSNGKFTLKGGQFVSPTLTLDEKPKFNQ